MYVHVYVVSTFIIKSLLFPVHDENGEDIKGSLMEHSSCDLAICHAFHDDHHTVVGNIDLEREFQYFCEGFLKHLKSTKILSKTIIIVHVHSESGIYW